MRNSYIRQVEQYLRILVHLGCDAHIRRRECLRKTRLVQMNENIPTSKFCLPTFKIFVRHFVYGKLEPYINIPIQQ